MIYGDDMTKAYLYNRGPHAVTFRGSIIVETMTWYGTENKVQQWHGDFASEVRPGRRHPLHRRRRAVLHHRYPAFNAWLIGPQGVAYGAAMDALKTFDAAHGGAPIL